MKQNICVVIFLLLSTICKAQTFIYPQNDSILTEYNDGKFWAYLNKNDFVVGLSCFEEKDDYGKYYHLDIFIKNLSETPIVFQPDSVHSNLLTKKDDTLKLEVYTNEEYQKKIKRSQAWAMALYGISAGINAGTAGYSTSYSTSYSSNGYAYTTITNHYDANAAYQANVASTPCHVCIISSSVTERSPCVSKQLSTRYFSFIILPPIIFTIYTSFSFLLVFLCPY